MRKILFRAKRTDNKEWTEGLYIESVVKGNPFGYITSSYPTEPTQIYTVTLGEFTGLYDKNGKKIFEGDIVKTDKFSEPNKQYIIKYDLQFGAFIGQDKYNMYFVTFDGDSDQFEIIGNIYDNSELLND